jgi:hypothetical protein
MNANILQLISATLMPLTAHGAPALLSSQLADQLIWPRNSQHPFSNAATFPKKSKTKRMMKSHLS